MITDDSTIAAKFESASYGALVRVLSIAGSTFGLDLAAGRIMLPHQDLSLIAHMDLGSVRFPPQRGEELRQWPMERGSIFTLVQEKQLTDACFRPRQAFDETSLSRTDPFRAMEPYARVVDAFCITIPLQSPAWAMLVFMRCSPHRPFDDAQTGQITRAKPVIARVVREGYQRDIQRLIGEPARTKTPPSAIPHTPQALSQTEQQILEMLMAGMTEKQIAEKMARSPHTTHVHVRNIYRKTSVTSRRELKQYFDETQVAEK